MLVYIACPYKHKTVMMQNYRIREATRLASRLVQAGVPVFNPLGHSDGINKMNGGSTNWMVFGQVDKMIIKTLTTHLLVLAIDGWLDSTGVQQEIAWWKEMGHKPMIGNTVEECQTIFFEQVNPSDY